MPAALRFALTFSILAATAFHAAAQVDHVILVSIDGLRPEFYLDTSWPAPNLQQMAAEGAKAERVQGVFPTVTYPSHTTMISGVLPAQHGIHYNNPFEPEGETGRWYWDYAAVTAPTLWERVRQSGGKTAAVSWPVSVGAPIDWSVPEVWSLTDRHDSLRPMREGAVPRGIWSELETRATGRLDQNSYSIAYMSRDLKTAAIAAYLFEQYRPNLLAVHLLDADHFQHEAGRDGNLIRRALGTVDAALGQLREGVERAGLADRTVFVITGDHGFVNTHTVFAPNVALAEAGLLEAKPDRGNWRAAFHSAGGAAFLHTRTLNDAAAADEARELIVGLPASVQRLFRIVERDELDASGAAPDAAFALAGKLGVAFSSRADGELVGPTTGGTHGYFPSDFPEIYTGFVAWGPGIQAGLTLHELNLQDIAPLINTLLELPEWETDGTAPTGILIAD